MGKRLPTLDLYMNHQGKIGCGVAVICNDEILLVKNDRGNWGIPKGGLEPGESYKQCAFRELKEETGIDINPNDVDECALDYINTKKGRIWFYWVVFDEMPVVEARNEIVDTKFVNFKKAMDYIMTYQQPIIDRTSNMEKFNFFQRM